MALKNNPFFLLRLPCTAGRREIVSASEEMSFILDSETCSNAQNELINPNKRLSAEINWFVDADETVIDDIRERIENDETISTDGLSPLSTLNAILYNFSLSTDIDAFELGYSVMEIDEKYSALNAEEIVETINRNRGAAKIGSVQMQDVSSELGKKREEIRQLITDKLLQLDQDTYIELITMIAEKCVADDTYEDGAIISDVIDQYEVRMQSALESNKEEIEKHIDRIKKIVNTSFIADEIESLIDEVKKWDKIAQPLQLKSQVSGMPHKISEALGSDLRDLSLYLHNEKGLTKEAFTLVNAMKSIFAELGDLSDQFSSDSDTLNSLLKGQKESEEIVAELNALQKESEHVKSVPSQIKVDSFVARIKKLDERLKSFDVDAETKIKIRENLCFLGRGTAIELHNSKHETAYALTIAKALVEEFDDIPSLRIKLNEDVTALNKQLGISKLLKAAQTNSSSSSNQKSPYPTNRSSSSSSNNKGCLISFLVIIGIVALFGIISGIGSSNKSSTSSYSSNTTSVKTTAKPTTKPASNTEKKYSSTSAVGDKVYVDIVLIEPEYGVYTSEIGKAVKSTTIYDDYVCKCTTSSGSTVWISFSASAYRSKIDATIDRYVNSTSSGFSGEKVRYSPAARLHGKVVKSDTVMSGLGTKIGKTSIIEYASIDIPTQSINKKTTISIKQIFPSYTITSGSSNKVTHVLCEYTDSSGKTNWIYMSVDEYKRYFDSTANPGKDTYANKKTFSTPKKVTVMSEYADDLISGASKTIGQKTLYVFSGVN